MWVLVEYLPTTSRLFRIDSPILGNPLFSFRREDVNVNTLAARYCIALDLNWGQSLSFKPSSLHCYSSEKVKLIPHLGDN